MLYILLFIAHTLAPTWDIEINPGPQKEKLKIYPAVIGMLIAL